MQAENWRARAACKGMDPEIFFPEVGHAGDSIRAQQLRAKPKATCAGCTVREPCLEAGWHEKLGIWGGLTERERRTLKRQRRQYAGEKVPFDQAS